MKKPFFMQIYVMFQKDERKGVLICSRLILRKKFHRKREFQLN